FVVAKEQRVDGNCSCLKYQLLRCTLMGSVSSYQIRILSKDIYKKGGGKVLLYIRLPNPFWTTGFVSSSVFLLGFQKENPKVRRRRCEESIQLRVYSIKELEILQNHFDKYPLITQKCADYQLFKQAFLLIKKKNKEHLTPERKV